MLTHLLQQPHYYLDGSKFKQVILKCFFPDIKYTQDFSVIHAIMSLLPP